MEMRENNDDYKLERWLAALLSLLFLLPFVADGQEIKERPASPLVTIDQVQQGALLLKTSQPGKYLPAAMVKTDIDITVSGMIARARVTQTFKNPSVLCVEALYVFPLPEDSAVDTLRMTAGNLVIEGLIKPRVEAKILYEQAKTEGRKASLVEQQRPNVFTTSVASLFPDEEVKIEIEYQQTVTWDQKSWRLRFPMVVAERYSPVKNSSSPIPGPNSGTVRLPITLRATIDAGTPIRTIDSTYHRVSTTRTGSGEMIVELADIDSSDHDFELVWQPELGREPTAALFTENVGAETYAMVMLTPPQSVSTLRLPRETIFIIDTSGSMLGDSMEQARHALVLALDQLQPADFFNVIEFDSDTQMLFPSARPADRASVTQAQKWVGSLMADDGTEMMGALDAALTGVQPHPGFVRQVIFITDGQVTNEDDLLSFIHKNAGDSRLFTVGIGSAPNSHFMSSAARFGRGTFTYIGNTSEVAEKMGELFRKLESPVLTDLQLQFGGSTVEMWPDRIPDLYSGEPLVVAVRMSGAVSSVNLAGKTGEKVWNAAVQLPKTSNDEGVAKLWARRKIEALTDTATRAADPTSAEAAIIELAMKHHLVSRFTSLVAVDVTPAGLNESRCASEMLDATGSAAAMPPGELPQTATSGALMLLLAAMAAACAIAVRMWV